VIANIQFITRMKLVVVNCLLENTWQIFLN